MAKQKSAPTKAQIEAENARKALTAAQERLEKSPNDAKAKAAVETAKAHVDTATEAESRERFVKYAAIRVNGALLYIKGIGNTFNPRSYAFTRADVDKIIAALRQAVTDLETTANNALAAPKQTKGGRKGKEKLFTGF